MSNLPTNQLNRLQYNAVLSAAVVVCLKGIFMSLRCKYLDIHLQGGLYVIYTPHIEQSDWSELKEYSLYPYGIYTLEA